MLQQPNIKCNICHAKTNCMRNSPCFTVLPETIMRDKFSLFL